MLCFQLDTIKKAGPQIEMAMSPEKRKALEKLAEILMPLGPQMAREPGAFAKGLAPATRPALTPEEWKALGEALDVAEAAMRKSLLKELGRLPVLDNAPSRKEREQMPIQEIRELIRKAKRQY